MLYDYQLHKKLILPIVYTYYIILNTSDTQNILTPAPAANFTNTSIQA